MNRKNHILVLCLLMVFALLPVYSTADTTVYVTKTGTKYHSRKNCPGLNNASSISAISESSAKSRGYTKCNMCWRHGNSVSSVKVGSTYKVAGNQYVVTSANTVSYKKPVSKKITKVKVPKKVTINGKKYKVTAIGNKAFVGCKKLKTVTITGTIKKIGKLAFYNCKNLKTIRVFTTKLTQKTVLKGAFQGINKKAKFYVPKTKKTSYKNIFLKRGATKKMKFKNN